MKKFIALLLGVTLVAGFTACGNGGSSAADDTAEKAVEDNASEDEKAAGEAEDDAEEDAVDDAEENAESAGAASEAADGTIVITGSTSVESILVDMKDEFEALNPGVTINYTGVGSSAGITDTINRVNNIGASSRELKEEEKGEGLSEVVFAYDGIAVIVNPENAAVENLTLENLQAIYAGEITNWSEVGGDDAEIFVVSREESSGTRSAFEELIKLDETNGLIGSAAVQEGNGTVQAAVAENADAVGYVSFSFIDDSVKAVTIDGVEATAENAKSGDYALSRPFIFCYFEDGATDAGLAFLEFCVSDDAQEIVTDHGGITVD